MPPDDNKPNAHARGGLARARNLTPAQQSEIARRSNIDRTGIKHKNAAAKMDEIDTALDRAFPTNVAVPPPKAEPETDFLRLLRELTEE